MDNRAIMQVLLDTWSALADTDRTRTTTGVRLVLRADLSEVEVLQARIERALDALGTDLGREHISRLGLDTLNLDTLLEETRALSSQAWHAYPLTGALWVKGDVWALELRNVANAARAVPELGEYLRQEMGGALAVYTRGYAVSPRKWNPGDAGSSEITRALDNAWPDRASGIAPEVAVVFPSAVPGLELP